MNNKSYFILLITFTLHYKITKKKKAMFYNFLEYLSL
jgi:hypothetical protein